MSITDLGLTTDEDGFERNELGRVVGVRRSGRSVWLSAADDAWCASLAGAVLLAQGWETPEARARWSVQMIQMHVDTDTYLERRRREAS